MPRKAMKESEKAETPMSTLAMEDKRLMEELHGLARGFQSYLESHGETFKRAGLCSIRDTCNVLIAQGQEADLDVGSQHVRDLEAQIRQQIAEQTK